MSCQTPKQHSGVQAQNDGLDDQVAASLGEICSLLHRHTGHDFSRYKEGTLLRRVRRRILLQHPRSVADYVKRLESDAAEAAVLLKDLLIGVTHFFRDPEAFRALAQETLPRMMENRSRPIRIWVPGCASGEEAYSLAVILREHLDRMGTRVQIFATDLDVEMLAEARQGRYGEEIVEQVSRERLDRFFVRTGQGYEVTSELRDMCFFSEHSLIRDPPFSQLDLISCRNVLIYLGAPLQKKLFSLFHDALDPGGFLFLGAAEGIAGSPDLFEPVDAKNRIFRRKETASLFPVELPVDERVAMSIGTESSPAAPSDVPAAPSSEDTMGAAVDRTLPIVEVDRQAEDPTVGQLQDELVAARAALKGTAKELETTNQALKSTNDELVATNQELQSTNEELAAVNRELRLKMDELAYVASFPEYNPNPIVEADLEGRVRYANPAAARLFPDLVEQGPSHPWLAGWQAIAKRLRQTPSSQSSSRTVAVGERTYHQEIYLVADASVMRGYGLDITKRIRAEETLRASEERFRTLADNAQDGIARFDRNGRYLYVNPFITRTLGLPAEAIVGRTAEELGRNVGVESWEDRLREVFVSGQPLRFDRRSIDGRWYDAHLIPEFHGDQVETVLAVSREITDRKRVEEALREAHTRTAVILEGITDAFYSLDDEWRFVTVNPAAEQAPFGRPARELLGKVIWDVFPSIPGTRIHQHYLDAVAKRSREHYEARSPLNGRWYEVFMFPRSGGLDVYLRDIDDRKRLERLYAVLSQVNEAIVRTPGEKPLFREVCRIVAEQGDFPLAWIGLVEGRVVRPVAAGGPEQSYVSEIEVEVDGELGVGPTGTCIRENRPVVNDDFATNPDASPWRRPALGHGFRASAAFPLRKGGKSIGALTLYAHRPGVFDAAELRLLLALTADLSYALEALEHERRRTETERELRAANEQLVDADQRKNDFLAMLSHELRNPLTPISNSLYILEHASPGGDQGRHALDVVGRQIGQLVRLVDDLLDVTRISRSKIQLRRGLLDFNEVVLRALEDHRSLFADRRIVVETTFASNPLPIHGDRERLAQVIGNLLQNAAKFTPAGGRVKVATAPVPARGRAGLRILDDGVGMDSAILRRLFQPFMQAEATLDRSRGGLGLGLALVKGLVEMHGGEVCALSDGPGKGSEFIVELPLDATPAETMPTVDGTEASSRRVLIIEDNVDAANSLREVLEFGQHVVTVAHNGSDGLAKARLCDPEIVFCDIGLPGLDGYQVARAFRADEALRDAFLVALSGYALPEDLQRAWEAGFSKHLAKPPSMEKIEDILKCAPRTGARNR
jgi:two-component system CheB/CheR fusion protein